MSFVARRITPPLALLLAACSLVNSPDDSPLQPNECDGVACDAGSDPCGGRCQRPSRCEQRDGGARCVCPEDYLDVEGDGSDCEPNPGCSNSQCGPGGRCARVGGSVECVCAEGYERAAADEDCNDIDECTRGTHDCDEHAHCIDTTGGFDCECARGYAGDGRRCEDVDECESMRCGEHAQCAFVPGYSECSCEPGYTGNPLAGCSDTDECANGLLECPEQATCSDRPGLDRCVCRGYYSDVRGDGSECADDRISLAIFSGLATVFLAAPPARSSAGAEEQLAVAGQFRGELTEFCDKTLQSNGKWDVAVAVFGEDDRCLWARAIGTPESDYVSDVVIDPEGGTVVSVHLSGDLELDGQTVGDAGVGNCMVMKFDPGGTLAWSLRLDAYRCDEISTYDGNAVVEAPGKDGLAIDAAGNVYFSAPLTAGNLGPLVITPRTEADSMLIKVSSSGIPQWVLPFVPEAPLIPVPITDGFAWGADSAGNLYINSFAAGSITLPDATIPAGRYFLALDTDGATRWLLSDADVPEVALDLGAADDGPRLAFEHRDQTLSTDEAVVQAVGLDGSTGWSTLVGSGEFTVREIEIAAGTDAVVAGTVQGVSSVADESARILTVGSYMAFVARLDRAGTPLWGHFFPSGWILWDLAASPSGKIYIASGYSAPADFGGGIVGDHGYTYVLGLRP